MGAGAQKVPHFAPLADRLQQLGDARRAVVEKRYQKSVWTHWGVALPRMDQAIREILPSVDGAALIVLADHLWSQPVWDCKITAGRILALKRVPPTASLWSSLGAKLPDLDGWAVADNLTKAADKCLRDDPRRLATVEGWLDADSFWIRRAALVYTLGWAKPGQNPEPMLAWAGRLSTDPEWFIQKAIGWWLRELSKHNPDRVRAFLDRHGPVLKTVAKKEAGKYLD